MIALRELVPDRASVLSLETAELAGYVLEALRSAGQSEQGSWNRRNFCSQAMREYGAQGQPGDMEIGIACSSAWAWLESNGLICRHPEQDGEWYMPTATGRQVSDHRAVRELISNAELPEGFLHPEFALNVRPLFLQSRFETAVFEAFKSLEIAIRGGAKLGHDLVGVQLASRAFNPEDGPLADVSSEKGERVALMNLMAGSLGSYKNSTSHRRVALTGAEAREMILLASHLLRIVDARTHA